MVAQGGAVRLLEALAHHRDGDGGAHRAPHEADRLDEAHVLRRLAVDLDDPVSGLDACLIGRCVLDGRHHREDVLVDRDLDTEAAELPFRLHLHLFEDLGRHVGGVGVEAPQHPLDGFLEEFLAIYVFDVVGLHQGEDFGERLEPFVGVLPPVGRAGQTPRWAPPP